MLPDPLDTSPCARCPTGACCFVYRVVVTPSDVHRLVRGTGRTPLELAILLPGEEGTLRMSRDGPLHELCLQKRPAETGDDHPCALLERGDGCFRCVAHASRPMVCRGFPLRPTDDGRFVALGEPCPPLWEPSHVRQEAARRLHGLWRIERDLGDAFARGWNRVADAAAPGRAHTHRMLFWWMLQVYDRVATVLSPWTTTPGGQDALIAGWDHPGPWTPGVERAMSVLDEAVRLARAHAAGRAG